MKKNNFKWFMFSFVMATLLLLSYESFAYPDLLTYNNFLDGLSPYYTTGQTDNSGTFFYPQDGTNNKLAGAVISFDNTFMSGSVPSTAIPVVRSSFYRGKVFKLPAYSSVVIHCDMNQPLYCNNDFSYSVIGSSIPAISNSGHISNLSSANISGDQVLYDNSGPHTSIGAGFSLDFDAFYLGTRSISALSVVNLGTSSFVLLVNDSNTDYFFSNQLDLVSSSSPVVTFDAPSISNDNICFLIYRMAYSIASTGSYRGYVFAVPHINYDSDIYTRLYDDIYLDNSVLFSMGYYDNVICSISTTDAGSIVVGIDNSQASLFRNSSYNIALSNLNADPDYVPFFIDTVYSTQKKAIYVKDGYISILNYDDLVKKLKEAGVGSTDLSRIIELLDLINSGGATGEQAKELMGLLDNLHNGVISEGDQGFNHVQGVFDQYSYLFDFDDDLHWIVTANNALFNYFAGFVLLCVVLLVFDRIMRG